VCVRVWGTSIIGQNHIRCMYNTFSRKLSIYTVLSGVYMDLIPRVLANPGYEERAKCIYNIYNRTDRAVGEA